MAWDRRRNRHSDALAKGNRQEVVAQQAPRAVDHDRQHGGVRRALQELDRSARLEGAERAAARSRAFREDDGGYGARFDFPSELADRLQRLIRVASVDEGIAAATQVV